MRRCVIIAAIIFCGCQHKPVKAPALPTPPEYSYISAEEGCRSLKDWYLEDNREYFDGKLPNDARVECAELANWLISVTFPYGGHMVVLVNTKYNISPQSQRLSLLHEECHVATWNTDGALRSYLDSDNSPEWKACRDDLIKKGAISKWF